MKAVITYKDEAGQLHTAIVPDSAITRSKEPFFMPDDRPWKALTLSGMVIDRLGKSIAPKYASRYYSQCITAVHPFAVDESETYFDQWGRDGALVVCPAVSADGLTDEMRDIFASLIESASRTATLKTGDLILFGDFEGVFPLERESKDYNVEGLSGCPPLRLKVR